MFALETAKLSTPSLLYYVLPALWGNDLVSLLHHPNLQLSVFCVLSYSEVHIIVAHCVFILHFLSG